MKALPALVFVALPSFSALAVDPQLVINELMIHPLEIWPTNQVAPTPNETEFVELFNAGTTTVQLAEYRFDAGIDFAFTNGTLAAGACAVLCGNYGAFTSAYPAATAKVFGQFTGRLNDGGERMTLSRFNGTNWVTEDTFEYIEDPTTDGTGLSLELIHPGLARLDDQYAFDWLASANAGGTPGLPNSRFTTNPTPVVGNVAFTPHLPPLHSSIRITARITGRDGDAVPSVQLEYRKDAIPALAFATTPMLDTGDRGDAVAGDGVYTGFLPPFGAPPVTTNGDVIEFRIKATDVVGTRTFPATNRAGAKSSAPYAYFCKFGTDTWSDTAYPGEYKTWHVIMSAQNRLAVSNDIVAAETANTDSTFLADATVIRSDGHLYLNGAVRGRGGTSRDWRFGGYRIELPAGEDLDGRTAINLNHQEALEQYLGMRIFDEATGGYAFRGSLVRLFFNSTQPVSPNQGIYFEFENFDNVMADRIYGNIQHGNRYAADGDAKQGALEYFGSTPASYTGKYDIDLNNPHTAWFEMIEFSRLLSTSFTNFPAQLPTRMNTRLWARHFATQVCLDNTEQGYGAPTLCFGDELRLSVNPTNGQFDIYPWDLDSIIGSSATLWGFSSGYNLPAAAIVRKYLFEHPIVPYYIGDVADVATNVMSAGNLTTLFNSMGSRMNSYKAGYLSTLAQQRVNLMNLISTNMTITGLPAGAPALLVPAATNAGQNGMFINLTGGAAQPYAATVTVNNAIANWVVRSNFWNMTAPMFLTGDVADVSIRTWHPNGNPLRELRVKAVAQRTPVVPPATIAANTTWAPASGIFVISNDVTVNAGVTLTIDPRATLLFPAGRKLTVNGTLAIAGTAANPVHLLPYGGTGAWSIEVNGAAAALVISNANLTLGRLFATNGAALRVYDSTLANATDANGIVRASGAAFVLLQRSILRDFSRTRFESTPTVIDQCLLERMSATAIEFAGSAATSTVSRTTIRNPTGTDGIGFSASTAGLVTNTLLVGMSGTGVVVNAATVRIVNSLFVDNVTGIRVAGASAATVLNCTIDGGTNSLNGTAAVTNAIFRDALVSITNGPATVANSNVELPGYAVFAGVGNLNRKAFFRDNDSLDYQLLPVSPCIGTGAAGANMGMTHPSGANPIAPANLALLSTSNTIFLAWSDLSPDETGFEIERSNDGDPGTFARIATTAAGVTNYTDSGLGADNSYFYRVRSAHARGASTYTDVVTIRTAVMDMTQILTNNLRITEIMYDAPTDSDNEEFLEFKNISTDTPLDLSGVLFTAGINFAFPNGTALAPQQFFVLVRNATAFTAAHPGVPYHGVFASGALNSGGEALSLRDASGTQILYVNYMDWHDAANSNGCSIVPMDPNPAAGDPSGRDYWRASANLGGSPGANDPDPLGNGIVINEVLAHTDSPLEDAIEFRNIGSNTVNIAGWYLTDNPNNFKQYRIPTNFPVNVAAGGYLAIYAHGLGQFGNTFLISELGSEPVILSAAVGTNLTGYRSTFDFDGAVENGVSHGRHVRSDGRIDITAMASRTFGMDNPSTLEQFRTGGGLPNSAPKVGPLVINEIMYNPGPGGKEYIELANTTAGPLKLYLDGLANFPPTNPTNTWSFNGAFEYTFPTGTVLTAGEHILLSDIPPAEFRTAMGIPAHVRIFGPFNGNLSNGGETIKLYKPGPPDVEDGIIPQIIADRVQYGDAYPWPAGADGDGAALEKRGPSLYGNDPTNWVALTIGGTPGALNNTAATPALGFADVSDSTVETAAVVNVEVTLQPAGTTTVSVAYSVTGGTATPNSDFSLTAGTLFIYPHETLKTIPLTILNDSIAAGEPNETVEITLSNLTGNAVLGGNTRYTHTIVDNDGATIPAPFIVPSTTTDFTNAITITMSPSVPNSTIHYTLTGTIPDRNDRLYTGPFLLTHSATISARTFLGDINTGATATVVLRAQPVPLDWPPPDDPPNSTRSKVGGSSDDGYQLLNNAVNINATAITLASSNYGACFRFNNLEIPPGAMVTNAYVQFTAAADHAAASATTIAGQFTAQPATLIASPFNIFYNRPLTANRVSWNIPAWTNAARTTLQRTPNLAAIVTEIAAHPNWAVSNAIAIIVTNHLPFATGPRSARTYDGATDQAAEFYAEWAPPGSHVVGASVPGPDQFTIIWLNDPRHVYDVFRSTNLFSDRPGTVLATNLPAHPSGTNTYTDTNATTPTAFYYLIGTNSP